MQRIVTLDRKKSFFLFGSRQTGKSTLVKSLLGENIRFKRKKFEEQGRQPVSWSNYRKIPLPICLSRNWKKLFHRKSNAVQNVAKSLEWRS